MRCVKLGIVATKCLAERLEGGRIYLGRGFGSLVHHGGRKEKGEGEGREEKGRGAEERRQREPASCLSIISSYSPRGPSLQ